MKRKFTIYCKPFSINSMYYSQKNIKTVDAREWTAQVLFALNDSKILKALEELRESFDPLRHSYTMDFQFNYPRNIFYTKKGDVSSKTLDETNVEKPLQDILCSPQYFDRACPDGAKNLNINDKYVTDVNSRKRPADTYSIDIEIGILDLKDLEISEASDTYCKCIESSCGMKGTKDCPIK